MKGTHHRAGLPDMMRDVPTKKMCEDDDSKRRQDLCVPYPLIVRHFYYLLFGLLRILCVFFHGLPPLSEVQSAPGSSSVVNLWALEGVSCVKGRISSNMGNPHHRDF